MADGLEHPDRQLDLRQQQRSGQGAGGGPGLLGSLPAADQPVVAVLGDLRGDHDRAGPNFMGLASLALHIGVFCALLQLYI